MKPVGRLSGQVVIASAVVLAGVVVLCLIPWRLVAAEPKTPSPSTVCETQPPGSKAKDGHVAPLEELLAYGSPLTHLRYKRMERECVGKMFHGVVQVWDVDEVDGKVMIKGVVGPLVCVDDGKGVYTAKPQLDFRFVVQDPQLKDKAAKFDLFDKVQVTAKLQRLWKEGTNASDSIAEFAEVTTLVLEHTAVELKAINDSVGTVRTTKGADAPAKNPPAVSDSPRLQKDEKKFVPFATFDCNFSSCGIGGGAYRTGFTVVNLSEDPKARETRLVVSLAYDLPCIRVPTYRVVAVDKQGRTMVSEPGGVSGGGQKLGVITLVCTFPAAQYDIAKFVIERLKD